jgi:hypothetical protein
MSYKEEYVKSIQPVTAMVNMLFSRSMRSGHPAVTHTLASILEIVVVLKILRTLSLIIGENLKIDSSNIKNFPKIQKVFVTGTFQNSMIDQ